MAYNQMQAVTGKKVNPNYVSMINAQTPYLLGLKRQEKEDQFAQEANALQREEMLINEQLARENLENQKKQAKRANLISLGNLGLKGGMGLYEHSEPVRNVVDKAVGAVGDTAKGLVNAVMPSAEAPMPSGDYGGMMGDLSDWGTWGAEAAMEFLPKFGAELAESMDWGNWAGGDIWETFSAPYADYLSEEMDWVADAFF